MTPFVPLFRSSHLQTVLAHFWPRPAPSVERPVESRFYATEPGVQVLVETQRPAGASRGAIVMVHGLEGSGAAGYMQSLSQEALARGHTAHRFHMRTCGGTEHLCQTLYHAGLTSDLLAVLRQMAAEGQAPVWLAGFSLGGNVVLKLAGELGENAPALIRGVVAVSVPIDLSACSYRIGKWDNHVYELRFIRKMRRRLCRTGRYRKQDFAGLNSIVAIDDRITAPSFGFRDAAHYYATQSAVGFLPGIRVPARIVQSRDDTFIPFDIFERPEVRENPHIELVATEHGGHLGFLARGPHRFWVDQAVMDFIR